MLPETKITTSHVIRQPKEARRIVKTLPARTLKSLAQFYDLRGSSEELSRFLAAHGFLVKLLKEAYPVITQYFGASDRPLLQLAFMSDSAAPDELLLLIPTRAAPEEVGPTLERFDREWWFEAADQAQGKMNIMPEYI